MSDYAIIIDGELIEFDKVLDYGYLPMIEDGNREWYLAQDGEQAKDKAIEMWKKYDAKELVYMVGEERIVELWSNGTSLSDWLEDAIDPAQEWAGYDGYERDVTDIESADDKALGIDDLIGEVGKSEDDEMEDGKPFDNEKHLRCWELINAWRNLVDELGFSPTVAYRHN